MSNMIAKPKEGKLVRDPNTMAPLPAEGTLVQVNAYWNRRAADGDVTLSKPSSTPEKPEKQK